MKLYAHCVRVHRRSCELGRINICGRKKLPFAEYSVVKEREIAICNLTETLVENTGLEPVTSWLQTRRSPS